MRAAKCSLSKWSLFLKIYHFEQTAIFSLYSTSRSVFAMYVCATRIAKAERLANVVASYLPGALPELSIQLPWGGK